MIFVYLLLATGLTLSAVAIYYSVIGLTSIFAAAFWPIIIMGTTLEVSKLVAASWLKAYWDRIPKSLKYYMMTAVVVLMLITSMGIFGFLSKAHLDQNIVSGDVSSKIVLIDEKIKIERENIVNAQSVIKQMDAAVNGVIATGDQEFTRRDGTTGVRSAAERSLQIRRSQAKDRAALTKQIEESQARIVKLQEESAPIRAEMRKVEAEVGPIKYIAKLIYGDSADTNLLEKAVTWVIMVIVFVFDPLAVLMLLGAQMTYFWVRENKAMAMPATTLKEDNIPQTKDIILETNSENDVGQIVETEPELKENPAVAEWNRMIHEAEQAVEKQLEDEKTEDKNTEINIVEPQIEVPADPVRPLVTEISLDVDPQDQTKKKDHLHDQGSKEAGNQDQESVGYVQNSEQGNGTLWQRIYYRKRREGSDQDNNGS